MGDGIKKAFLVGNKSRNNWLRLGDFQYFNSGGEGGQAGGEDPGAGAGEPGAGGNEPPKTLTYEDVQKMLQSETDKIRTEYSKKNAELQKLLDAEKNSKLTEQEKLELAQKQIAEKEAELQKEKNGIHAVKELENAEMSTKFLPFVTSESDEKTTELVQTLKAIFDAAVSEKVDDTFKGTGRKVPNGKGTIVNTNPTDFSEIAKKHNIRK